MTQRTIIRTDLNLYVGAYQAVKNDDGDLLGYWLLWSDGVSSFEDARHGDTLTIIEPKPKAEAPKLPPRCICGDYPHQDEIDAMLELDRDDFDFDGSELKRLFQDRYQFTKSCKASLHLFSVDELPGFCPDEDYRIAEAAEAMDEAVVVELHRFEDEETQREGDPEHVAAFIEQLCGERRTQLAGLLRRYYGARWNADEIVAWVQGRIDTKLDAAQPRDDEDEAVTEDRAYLAAYCSCIYSLRRKFEPKPKTPEFLLPKVEADELHPLERA